MGAISSNESDRPTASNVSPKAAANELQDVDHGDSAESEEIAPFLKDGSSVSNFQSKMESEGRDDSWAQFMEAQIAAYLASKPTFAAFQIALIQCRSSMCEIQAVGYGPDAAATWFAAVNDLPRQPWAVEFGDGNFEMRQFAPDVTSILMQMARVKSDSTVDSANVLANRR